MKNHTSRLLASAVLTGALLAPTVASAQDEPAGDNDPSVDLPDDLNAAKRFCTRAINNRLVVLEVLERVVNRADAVTDAHEASLDDINASTRTSLTGLRDEIGTATDDTIEGLCREIVTENYVYRLRVPQHRLTITGDRLVKRVENLRVEADELEAEIADDATAGEDTSEAEAALAAMRSALDTAAAEAGSIGDNVIALTPADVDPAAPNAVLEPIRTDRRDARVALRTARESKREINNLLDA